MLLSYIFNWPSMVKYDVVSNNRGSKLHSIIDYLFFIGSGNNLHVHSYLWIININF